MWTPADVGARRVFIAASLAAAALVAQGIGALAAVAPSADLTLTMTGPATATAGTNITYLMTITNNGPDIAQGVQFNPQAPTHTSTVSFTFTAGGPSLTVAPGAITSVAWVVHIDATTPAGTVIVNTQTITTTTADPNLANNTATVTTTVGGGARQVLGHGVDVAAVEGAGFSGSVATFTDATPGALPADYTAVITWGDGSSSAGTVVATGPGAFAVRGTHTYAEEGSNPISTVLTFPGGTVGFASTANVADAALAAQGMALPATALMLFAGTVATFTDADPGGVVSDYTATISWGDGTTSAGVVSAQGSGFTVSGSHTFGEGRFTITTSIHDAGASAVATSTITVDLTPPVTTAVVTGTFKDGSWKAVNPATLTLTATDNLTGVAATYYTINGGAPQTYTGPVSLGPGAYVIQYWSVDGVGNVEPANTILVRVNHRHGDGGDGGDGGDDGGDGGDGSGDSVDPGN
ncbi:MAG TPA: hypothetical protein VIO37_03155 [Candidatus Dormibacteraeota bacterium]|jgi:uncharacterized repeat protein (TIGR01451 family)